MKLFSQAVLAALAALALQLSAPAGAAGLREDHPLIGTWQITLPDGSCREIYRYRSDGTTLVTSAEEVAESSYNISDQPDPEGFYKQTDTIVKDNGKRDCSGEVTQVGHQVVTYLLFHPSGNMFLMCFERDRRSCIGPFIRVHGSET
jgi:hypothetical protein